jgi:hypothetical protein
MISTRRGISILELMVVLSASTVVLTLSSVLLQRVMRIHIQSRADSGVERTTLRLSDRFRDDVHQARSAETDRAILGEHVVLRLANGADRHVEYSYDDGILLRSMPKSDGQISREEFVFPAGSVVKIESQDAPQRLVMTITAPRDSDSEKQQLPAARLTIPLSMQVEAVIGSDWRFAGAPPSTEVQQ